jgi:hypothetical protein
MADAYYVGEHNLSKDDLKTVPFDARFPTTNQTRNCWQNYVDFYRCQKKKVILSSVLCMNSAILHDFTISSSRFLAVLIFRSVLLLLVFFVLESPLRSWQTHFG